MKQSNVKRNSAFTLINPKDYDRSMDSAKSSNDHYSIDKLRRDSKTAAFTLIKPKAYDRNEVSGREQTYKAADLKGHRRIKDSDGDTMSKSAFTLIELIVVMAILAILVLLAAPKLLGYSEKARTTQIRNDIKVLETKIDEYLINHESFPDTFIDGVVGEGQLYDRKGKIEAAPSDLKVVDRTFYPETELPGTFYTDPDGEVIYEDDINTLVPGIGGTNTPLTDEEITDLINAGYIPVADADELRQIAIINFDADETPIYKELTWGKGTKWEGQYIGRLDSMYVQVADIDLSSYSEGAGWFPIGYYMDTDGDGSKEDFYFSGIYNGGNYDISNLYINRPSQNYFGLFGQIDGAKILNVIMTTPTLIAESDIGALVGYGMNDNSISNIKITGLDMTINDGWCSGGMIGDIYDESNLANLSIEGTITLNADAGQIGGLIGWSEAKIYNAYANVNIIDNYGEAEQIGGLIGWSSESTIEKSYSAGEVQGNLYVGGLLGGMYDGTILKNSYSTGQVTGNDYIGGLVGTIGIDWGSRFSTGDYMINSHSVSAVIATGINVGGLVGEIIGYNPSEIIINSYYYQGPENNIGTHISESEMAIRATFEDWDFNNTWGIVEKPYPTFKIGSLIPENSENPEEITMKNPMEDRVCIVSTLIPEGWITISTIQELNNIRNNLSGNYILTADIDASGIEWEPIDYFVGTLDGNCYKITNLSIDDASGNNLGLFGYLESDEDVQINLFNIELKDVDITGANYIGGLVGMSNGAKVTIDNSYVTGTITGESTVGGIVGYGEMAHIFNSYSDISITAAGDAGGLVGYADASIILNSYAAGTVAGTEESSNVGGLVGVASGVKIFNSGSYAEVRGNSQIGGIVGKLYEGAILNSYNVGNISGLSLGNNIGGIVGEMTQMAIIENVINTGNVYGDARVGGLVGNAYYNEYDYDFDLDEYEVYGIAEITNSYTTGIITGNSNVDGILGGEEINGFYDSSRTKISKVFSVNSKTTTTGGINVPISLFKLFSKLAWDTKYTWDMSDSYPSLKKDAISINGDYLFRRDTREIVGYLNWDYNATINIPQNMTIDGVNFEVIGIGEAAFYGMYNVWGYEAEGSIIIPEGIKRIEKYAFNNIDMEIIQLPNSIEYIGPEAFYSAKKVINILPLNLKTIGNKSFHRAGLSGDLIIPESVEVIGEGAFGRISDNVNMLDDLIIMDGIKYIGASAFIYNDLNSVTLPNSINQISKYSFMGNKLTSVIIPPNVKKIDSGAFSENELASVSLPNSLEYLETGAFSNNKIKSINIPSSLKYVGDNAFMQNELEEVILNEGLVGINAGAFLRNKIQVLTLPNSLEWINSTAFKMNQIYKLTFAENSSLKFIGTEAFQGNKFHSTTIDDRLVIPNSVTAINSRAFASSPYTLSAVPIIYKKSTTMLSINTHTFGKGSCYLSTPYQISCTSTSNSAYSVVVKN